MKSKNLTLITRIFISKIRVGLLSKAILCFLLTSNCLHAQSDTSNPLKVTREAGISFFRNIKYNYPGYGLHYYTPRFIYKNKIRLRTDLEAYRIAVKNILAEYNKLNIVADYLIPLPDKGRYKQVILPKIGASLIWDLTNLSDKFNGLTYVPRMGIDYIGQYEKFRFFGFNSISTFKDGLWYELMLGSGYRAVRFMEIQLKCNIISAITYNGHSGMGFYPFVTLNFLPGK